MAEFFAPDRIVTIWPDNDLPGIAAAKRIAHLLLALRARVFVRWPPAVAPVGWDAADAIGEGYGPDRLRDFLSLAEPFESEAPHG